MAKKTKNNEELLETIRPENISIEDNDSDMPAPETKVYKKYMKLNDTFMSLFYECINPLPYKTVLTNGNGNTMALAAFVNFVEQNRNKILVEDMNLLISYIDNMPFRNARNIMGHIKDKEKQARLWEIFDE